MWTLKVPLPSTVHSSITHASLYSLCWPSTSHINIIIIIIISSVKWRNTLQPLPWQVQLFPGKVCNPILSHVSPRFVRDTLTTHFYDFSSFTSGFLYNPSMDICHDAKTWIGTLLLQNFYIHLSKVLAKQVFKSAQVGFKSDLMFSG